MNNEKCSNPGGDCEILKVAVREKCPFHTKIYRQKINQQYYKKRKGDVRCEKPVVTPKDVLVCINCGPKPIRQYSPDCKRRYWKNAKKSKYNTNYFITV